MAEDQLSPEDYSPKGKNLGVDLVQNENKESISYCGLYCGKCFKYSCEMADPATDLKKDLQRAKIDKQTEIHSKAPSFDVFIVRLACFEASGDLVKLHCSSTCRSGGGPPDCRIRNCCRKGGIDGCWQCEEFESCPKLESLSFWLGDSHLNNIRRLSRKEISAFLHDGPPRYHMIKRRNSLHNEPYGYL